MAHTLTLLVWVLLIIIGVAIVATTIYAIISEIKRRRLEKTIEEWYGY